MEKKKTVIIPADGPLEMAANFIKQGGVVAYPTETFYGLAVDPFNEEAVKRLFELKGRDFAEPVSVIIGEIGMLLNLTDEVSDAAQNLMERFWPGPLTIVLGARVELPQVLTAGRGTIGVRVPGLKAARRLSEATGNAITATSANPSGKPAPVEASEVAAYFDGQIDLIIDGGTLTSISPSTVVEAKGKEIRLIREGVIAFSEL